MKVGLMRYGTITPVFEEVLHLLLRRSADLQLLCSSEETAI
jgi:hypothetical protein